MKLAFLAATIALGACQHVFETMRPPVRKLYKWERHPKFP